MRPELIQATELLQSNAPKALEEALGLLQNTVYSFSMKVCGNPQDAEDTTQEVLFTSLDYLARIREPQALAVWLYTVARNRCWRMRRKYAPASVRSLSLDDLMPDEAELDRLLQNGADSPESAVIQAEQHHLLHQAVLRIPPNLRIVLVLHDMEELTTAQVAQILDLQEGTVRIRLHRARLSVRKEVHRLLDGVSEPSTIAEASSKKNGRARAGKRPDDCRELFSNLSEYLDGRMEPVSCDQARKHIEACPACIAFLRDLRAAIDRCKSLQIPCDPDIAARLRAMLTQEYTRLMGMQTEKYDRRRKNRP
jgi:RNA polymerase sigma-70 factor (ECF subfamily)